MMRDRIFIFILLLAVVPCALLPADVVVCLRRAFAEPLIGPIVERPVSEDDAADEDVCDCCRRKPARPAAPETKASAHGCRLCVHVPTNRCDPGAKDPTPKFRPVVAVLPPVVSPPATVFWSPFRYEPTHVPRPSRHDPDRDRPLRI